jgi:DtxR family Mn-dependent transcriptional regulator
MELILSKSEREALKAIYRLTGSRTHPQTGEANTGALAEALGLSPGTVTATVKRLADRGLADHKLYRGVELTPLGRGAAIAAIRRHRIVERFLSDMLGYAWNEADRLAGSIEHDLPQEIEDRLFVALRRPSTCPHGFPIPEPEMIDIPEMPPMYDLEAGDIAVVAVPGSTDAEVVAFLDTLGLRPGVVIEVREKHPFDGPIVLRVAGNDRTVSQRVAQQIFVRKDEQAKEEATVTTTPTRREQSA